MTDPSQKIKEIVTHFPVNCQHACLATFYLVKLENSTFLVEPAEKLIKIVSGMLIKYWEAKSKIVKLSQTLPENFESKIVSRKRKNLEFPTVEKFLNSKIVSNFSPESAKNKQQKEADPDSSQLPTDCCICMSTFERHHDLWRHERRHIGIKPFKCNFCPDNKYFTDSGNIKKHIRHKHPGIMTNRIGLDYIKNTELVMLTEYGTSANI